MAAIFQGEPAVKLIEFLAPMMDPDNGDQVWRLVALSSEDATFLLGKYGDDAPNALDQLAGEAIAQDRERH